MCKKCLVNRKSQQSASTAVGNSPSPAAIFSKVLLVEIKMPKNLYNTCRKGQLNMEDKTGYRANFAKQNYVIV